ncbi:DUF3124 domain-containing protein [Floridanema evergladense]|uniref:DUF3124 domain-containing protein n=1 Tax=Floridanema evergladense TaxID=3396172 RepID=UPI0039A73FD8
MPLLVLLTACTEPKKPVEPATQLKAVTLDNTVKIVGGQTIYVPIYSQIYVWERNRTMELTSTLSVRNTDRTNPIIIAFANYYDSNGKLVRKYLKQPIELPPLASTNFIVDQEDTTGGSGASFVVEWVTQKPVSEPVIEAVMINAGGNQGISLISPGRVIKTRRGAGEQGSRGAEEQGRI